MFLSGDPNPRHSLPGFGQLYWLVAVFVIIGFIDLVRRKDSEFKRLVFSWLFIAPIASSLTIGGGGQATRLFLMLPPLVIFIGLGVDKLKSRLFVFISLALLVISLCFWWHEYFVHYPKKSYEYWHYGYQEMISWLKDNQAGYQRVIINNNYEPGLIRYLFWTKKELSWLRNNFQGDQVKEGVLNNFNGFNVGNVFFGGINQEDKIGWLTENLNENSVYLAFQGDEAPGDWNWQEEPPAGLKILEAFNNPLNELMAYWVTKEE